MSKDLVEQARRFDFSGLRLAGIARMSHEDQSDPDAPAPGFRTGRDIAGREVQAEDCEGYITSRGGAYVYTYEEPDTSAYKQRRIRLPDGRTVYRVVRPVFEGALEDLKRGVAANGQPVDGLVVYDVDRLTRNPRHLEDCIEVVVHYGRPIIDITGSLDLLTDNGRTMARVIVATANKQSADTARRVRRKHAVLQQAGIPAGGRRPFGCNPDRRTLCEPEADLIREAVGRILEGAPLSAITGDWNRRKITTGQGNRWARQNLIVVLRNPRLCGLRGRIVHEVDPDTQQRTEFYEVVLSAKDGSRVVGLWDKIITVGEWERLIALIGDRAYASRAKNTRKYLLSGILRCGRSECGAKMCGGMVGTGDAARHRYFCPGVSAGGCGGTAIAGPVVDDYLTEAIVAKLEQEAQRRDARSPVAVWPGEQALADVREQLSDLTRAWRAKQIKGARYFPMLAELEQDETDLEQQAQTWRSAHAGQQPALLTIRQDWPNKTLAERRALAQRVLAAVTVKAAAGRRFDPQRLEPHWAAL
jgi:site-specific DNA recombinase